MKKQNKQQNTPRAVSVNENRIIEKVLKSVDKQKQDKYLEYNLQTTVSNTVAFVDISSTIVQGITESQRIGNQVRLKRAKLRYNVASADTTNFMRFIVFRWKVSTTSDTPSDAELWLPNSSFQWYSQFLPTKPSRFQVIFDKTVALSAQGPSCANYEVDIPLNWNCAYDTSVNTGKDHLYFAYISDSAAPAHPAMSLNMLLHYHDTA